MAETNRHGSDTRVTLRFQCSICGQTLGRYHGKEFIIEPVVGQDVRILCLYCWGLLKNGSK